MNMKLSISILKSNYTLEDTILKINDLDYNGFVHVDVCDGEYVESVKTDIDSYITNLEKCSKPLDFHLMVNHPLDYIDKIKSLHPVYVTVHPNCLDDLKEIKKKLDENNIKMGLAINPLEDINNYTEYFNLADLILIMSVHPGKGGQKFLNFIPNKLDYLNKIREDNNYGFVTEVDGGINDITIPFIRGKVDLFVCGSFICCSDDYDNQINKLKNIL